MSIDLTTLITNLQADVDAVDSSTSMSSILSLMHKARKITSISNYYDSAGLLPVDSSYDGMLAFSKADNTMYKFVDSGLNSGTVQGWHKADSASGNGGGGDAFAIAGSTYGYSSGGEDIKISRWSFASDGNAVEQGDLIANSPVAGGAGKSSSKGYRAGGFAGSPLAITTAVQGWPFSALGDAVTQPATLTVTRYRMNSGPIQPSAGDFVFHYGGLAPPNSNIVDKYPIAADAAGTDVGDLDHQQYFVTGSPSGSDGYLNGRNTPGGAPTYTSENADIKKFPFASYAISDTGYNTLNAASSGGYSGATHSPTHSYQMGGYIPTGEINVIGKYPFSADANSSDVGDLTTGRYNMSGAASPSYGYAAGGRHLPSTYNIIDKFSFSSDGNATDVGDLTAGGQYPSEGVEK